MQTRHQKKELSEADYEWKLRRTGAWIFFSAQRMCLSGQHNCSVWFYYFLNTDIWKLHIQTAG